jgi:hypothetical protein
MTWLLWRQHRRQGAVTAGLLAVIGLLLWITGINMAHTYRAAMAACQASGTCGQITLFQGYNALFDVVNLTVLVPALVGVFWGVVIVGRELETGTNRLVWTQSVTRRRWLRAKIVLLLVASAVAGAVLTAVVTWWSGTLNSLHHNRFDGGTFDIQGVVPIAYTLFAAALGLACGVLWRRTLPATATTIGSFMALRLLIENYLRPHYATPLTRVTPLGSPDSVLTGAWTLRSYIQLRGHAVSSSSIPIPSSCAGAGSRKAVGQCLAQFGYQQVTQYQPGSRFWHFQLIETVIFLGLATILTLVAVVALRRQDA